MSRWEAYLKTGRRDYAGHHLYEWVELDAKVASYLFTKGTSVRLIGGGQ